MFSLLVTARTRSQAHAQHRIRLWFYTVGIEECDMARLK